MHCFIVALALNPSSIDNAIEWIQKDQMLPFMKGYWIVMGVLEPDEPYFNTAYGVEYDVAAMVWRLENTPLDAPPFDARHTLPNSEVCFQNKQLIRRFQRFLEGRRPYTIEGTESAEVDALIADCERRYLIWDSIHDCLYSWQGKEGRRNRMNTLRKLVGSEAFYSGDWPDPLPDAAYNSQWDDTEQQMEMPE